MQMLSMKGMDTTPPPLGWEEKEYLVGDKV